MARKKNPDKELKDQRIPIMMSPSELEAIDDWSFKHRIRSRGEAIRRLCHMGLRAEATERDLLQIVMKGLEDEAKVIQLLNPDNKVQPTAMKAFQASQLFLREVYALITSRFMEGIVFKTAPTPKEAIEDAKEISDRLKGLGSSQKQIDAFLNFSKMLKERPNRDEKETD